MDAAAGAQVVAVATRLPVALARRGGWGEHSLTLPEGRWRDVFSGVIVDGGSARLAAVLTDLPVALLLREPDVEAGQVRTTTVPR